MLSDDAFKASFFAEPSDLRKMRLCIDENRYTVWPRPENNLSFSYLLVIKMLPDNWPVIKRPRQSGGPGNPMVMEIRCNSEHYGTVVPIYLKAFFSTDDIGCPHLMIQSFKKGEEY